MQNSNKTFFRGLLLAVFSLLLSLDGFSQRPDYNKMSALVREACHESANEALPNKVSGKALPSIIAFVKLADSNTALLADKDCKVFAQYGDLCIAEIPLPQLGPLSREKKVLRIEAGRGFNLQMDTTAQVINAVPVQEGLDFPQGYTGKGVVVGVQDVGFDLTHPTFWSGDMSRYRIQAMWDQLSLDTIGSLLPVGRDYVGQEELLAVQHPRDGLIQTHGTHTTGIAAGSGGEGGGALAPYRGIAYDADICLVSNATSEDVDLVDPKDMYKYTYATDALGFKYIFDYADSVGKPCVINFSEGSRMDFHGEDKLFYEMLDSLVGPGHIIVASAGNMGEYVTYFRKDASEHSASVNCARGQRYSVTTTKSKGDFALKVSLLAGDNAINKTFRLSQVLNSPDSTYMDSISGYGITCKLSASAYRSCYNDSDIVCDWKIDRDLNNVEEDARYSMNLQVTGDGVVEMFPATGSFASSDNSSNAYSINSPSSAPRVISVGMTGYRTEITAYYGQTFSPSGWDVSDGERNENSSVGPTFDGRIKPDVMAPGQNIISSYSSFYEESNPYAGDIHYDVRHFDYNGRTYAWNSNTGTSMSAPVVAGVIALWLQACPTLSPEDCLDIFSRSCTHFDKSLSYPNCLYGYGQIDAEAGMKLVLQKAAAGIKDIHPSDEREADDRIFTLSGSYVGRSLSSLPRGIYIRNGKKFIK